MYPSKKFLGPRESNSRAFIYLQFTTPSEGETQFAALRELQVFLIKHFRSCLGLRGKPRKEVARTRHAPLLHAARIIAHDDTRCATQRYINPTDARNGRETAEGKDDLLHSS